MEIPERTFTVFRNLVQRVHTGADLVAAFEAGRAAWGDPNAQLVTLFDDATGDRTEVDREVIAEAPPHPWLIEKAAPSASPSEDEPEASKRSGPGRPKLGVISREVSLMPRHWEWLNAQPSGASAAIRRLVDEARKTHAARDEARRTKDAAFKFLNVAAGDLPDFEETTRDLYEARFDAAAARMETWPVDVRDHARRLVGLAAAAHAKLAAKG
jgi:hypothetical protein